MHPYIRREMGRLGGLYRSLSFCLISRNFVFLFLNSHRFLAGVALTLDPAVAEGGVFFFFCCCRVWAVGGGEQFFGPRARQMTLTLPLVGMPPLKVEDDPLRHGLVQMRWAMK